MKKVLSIVLTIALALGMGSAALADIVVSNLKVEIDPALRAFAAEFSETAGFNVRIETVGGGSDYGASVRAALQSGNMFDIFVVEGVGGFETWREFILDVTDQPFAQETSVGLTVDGRVYGFPVAIEGFGIAYNGDLLAQAGIDPADLTTITAFKEACEKLDGMKDELGIDSAIAMATSISGGMWWVTANQNFSTYLSANLPYGDRTYIDMALNGEIDTERMTQYAEYLRVLFDYADQDILLNGNYDAQVNQFATQKAVFIHQGNWIDPNLKAMDVTFDMGYRAQMWTDEPTTGLMVAAPSWYVVNSQGPNVEQALQFLNDMVFTEAGQNYMVNEAGMVPAF
ncbi:MAG: ABC transporter substrate-binding protein, partial [Clostridia bacterium]|nr:ABC transporter substrate-binding protein [Clostridia bacterium]